MISDVLEDDCHRVFSVLGEYLAVKLLYLGDAKAGEDARLVKLTHLCARSALYVFSRRYQEGLKVGVFHERYRKWFCDSFILFYIFLCIVG